MIRSLANACIMLSGVRELGLQTVTNLHHYQFNLLSTSSQQNNLYRRQMFNTSKKDKRLNSINRCDPIVKPDNPLDKSTQRGKPSVVTRAHPNFSGHCGVRHTSIFCPAIYSVSDSAPATTLTLPPSKCSFCTLLKKTITVRSGVQSTFTERKL